MARAWRGRTETRAVAKSRATPMTSTFVVAGGRPKP